MLSLHGNQQQAANEGSVILIRLCADADEGYVQIYVLDLFYRTLCKEYPIGRLCVYTSLGIHVLGYVHSPQMEKIQRGICI